MVELTVQGEVLSKVSREIVATGLHNYSLRETSMLTYVEYSCFQLFSHSIIK